ncbi:Alpha 1,2-mannosidase [Oopsacas minuta]|uniref:alpha-1,2-Mannosidase n=1 Tax=Oopsacas minuta TaxID=111878 RepID=A0AAV7JDT5_9METZ|nr:Alpha 1,2-mannosidase [Oopsacas minuta]
MEDEFERAREWVRTKFDLKVSSDLSLFEINIRYVAGFISIYTMTQDQLFLDKAKECADLLLPAFNSPSGIPYSLINPITGGGKSWGWAGGSSILAEIGTLHLEFLYLSYLTNDPVYYEKVRNVRTILKDLPKNNGLYPNYINPHSKSWGQAHMSLGALGDSFYEYLYKTYLLTSRTDANSKEMYFDAMEAIRNHMLKRSSTGLLFIADLKNGRTENKMDHLGCFSGGLFALSSIDAPGTMNSDYLEIGEELTKTCHESYDRSDTKLGPEVFYFNGGIEARANRPNEYVYLLRPETVESYFVLWRVTGKQLYRDWAWEAVLALEKHTRTENGYSGIRSVYSIPTQFDDVQQSFFLAETLKYLFLTFSDNSVYPLDKWVFNTEAHPFPIMPGVDSISKII